MKMAANCIIDNQAMVFYRSQFRCLFCTKCRRYATKLQKEEHLKKRRSNICSD
jgi:hypothetical protein